MAAQLLPQAPQFALSVFRFAQEVPHLVSSVGHCAAHEPRVQTWPAAQEAPHEPQWFTSLVVSTHAPLQLVLPKAHEQLPPVQVAPPWQVVPQAPQSVELVWVLTQDEPHLVVPALHDAWHWPSEQTELAPQVVLHVPQFAGSLWVSAHLPLQ